MRCITLNNLPPGSACTYVRWNYSRSGKPEPHTHSFHELFWVEDGEGFEWVNGGVRKLLPGMLVLTRADDAHSFSSASDGQTLQFVNFAFPTGAWTNLRKRCPSLRGKFFDVKPFESRQVLLSPAELDRIRSMAQDVEAGFRDPFSVETFFVAVINLLVNHERRADTQTLPSWLADACNRIRNPAHFIGGTAAFVRLAGRSPEHVARVLRQHLNVTPTELVNEVRLRHAAVQLCSTDLPILEIASDCGFENAGHFFNLFRGRFKTTPRKYRLENAYPLEEEVRRDAF